MAINRNIVGIKMDDAADNGKVPAFNSTTKVFDMVSPSSGACGVSGVSGVSGTTGSGGACGISGTAGTNGACGVSGISGVTGVPGSNGACGISGISGISGVIGATGPQAISSPAVISSYFDLDLPASDHTAVGFTTNAILSGATVAAFNLVFLGTGGKWLLVDADAVATCKGMIGIALEAKNDTQAMLTALSGSFVRDDTWAWTIGDTLYAGETAGAIQNTIPTGADAIIKVVGFAVSADVIFFYPSPDQQSVVA